MAAAAGTAAVATHRAGSDECSLPALPPRRRPRLQRSGHQPFLLRRTPAPAGCTEVMTLIAVLLM
jgi:hypothetical protein